MKVTNTKQFIDKATQVHNRAYNYDNTIYVRSNQPIIVTCKEHGDFNTTPNAHLQGYGCNHCGINRRSKAQTKDTDYFVQKSKQVHGDLYDYSKSVYEKTYIPIEIICKEHGSFWQRPKDHISRTSGCPVCARNNTQQVIQSRIKSVDEFVDLSNVVHRNKYNYSLISTTGNTHLFVDIICPIHGIFSQKRYVHLQGGGCPKCRSSKGEREICKQLDKYHVKYIHQHKFDDCVNPVTNRSLAFDFFITELRTLIEFDGKQHFEPVNFFAMMNDDDTIKVFNKGRIHDNIKNQYALTNNIQLIRIPYTEINNIPTITLSVIMGQISTDFPHLIVQ